MERHITFECQGLVLEGKLNALASDNAAVITHPHPQYGGDMDSAVVETISKAYQNRGWSTLCFNFRGTGKSQGEFDNGVGEQKDVDAAIAYLTTQGVQEIELAGYSFGAYVLACRAQQMTSHHPMRFIAPPVAFIDFKPIHQVEGLKQVIVGTNDEFAPVDQIKSLTPHWNLKAKLNVIGNADHFYWNALDELQKILEDAINKAKSKIGP